MLEESQDTYSTMEDNLNRACCWLNNNVTFVIGLRIRFSTYLVQLYSTSEPQKELRGDGMAVFMGDWMAQPLHFLLKKKYGKCTSGRTVR